MSPCVSLGPGLLTKMLPFGVSMDNASPDELAVATRRAKERYLAVAFVLGSDRVRYGRLIEDLENSFIQGNDKYPTEVTEAYNLLLHWKQDPRFVARGKPFTTVETELLSLLEGRNQTRKRTFHTSLALDAKRRGTMRTTVPVNRMWKMWLRAIILWGPKF
jgi:hypothetical protein